MKPTVIASGNSENPQSHPGGSGMNSTGSNIGPSRDASTSANAHANTRQHPQYQTGFGVDPDLDDIFSDAGLRSRLNRFRDPFGFARKRCGNNDPNADPYSRYFDDDTDFFHNFGSFPGRRRTGSQGAASSNANPFYDHIPPEFRHYIPENFGFADSRNAPQQVPQQQQQTQQHPQQYYEAYVQPSSPTYAQPPQQKPKLCDAAIQTEDLSEQGESKDGKNLKQYGMRNTVDLGQKSPPEECRGPRSQSAPPVNGPQQNIVNDSTGSAPQQAYANASSYAHAAVPQPQADGGQRSQGTQPMTPPHPPPRQHAPNPHQPYQPWQPQQQQQTPQQAQKQQHSSQPQQNSTPSGSGHIRTVPIFVEGRSDPVVTRSAAPTQQHQQPPQQQPRQKPGHPTPLNMQQTPAPSNQAPPQTPHTAECISKIQAIQRDVLDLMSKVEKFKGMRNDKEYMYLDEMLTRNLLKLDTIDTNGKDSIRLARREAIKCIQASINVLEAKAEENAKTAQQTVMDDNEMQQEQKAEDELAGSVNEGKLEDEAASLPPENVPIPLPPPPEKKSIDGGEEVKSQAEATQDHLEPSPSQESKQTENQPGLQKVEIVIPLNPPAENMDKLTLESTGESTTAEKESTPSDSAKGESISPKKVEESSDSVEPKPSGGAVKKKIIKKKKVVGDKKDKSKSESASPAENPAEDPSKSSENKGQQEPSSQPQ